MIVIRVNFIITNERNKMSAQQMLPALPPSGWQVRCCRFECPAIQETGLGLRIDEMMVLHAAGWTHTDVLRHRIPYTVSHAMKKKLKKNFNSLFTGRPLSTSGSQNLRYTLLSKKFPFPTGNFASSSNGG